MEPTGCYIGVGVCSARTGCQRAHPSLLGLDISSSSSSSTWNRALLEKLTVSQLVNIFPVFYGTPLFVSVFRTSDSRRRLEPDRSNPRPCSLPHFSITLIQQAHSQLPSTSAPAEMYRRRAVPDRSPQVTEDAVL